MSRLKPRPGALAYDEEGRPGLITDSSPMVDGEGNQYEEWIGLLLERPVDGLLWRAKKPDVVGYLPAQEAV